MEPTQDPERGKAGANVHSKPDKCDICGRQMPAGRLIVAHNIEPTKSVDHILVCQDCPIPKGFWGCGCGG